MKILTTTLTLIVLLFSTQIAAARTDCDATCRAHENGESKTLRTHKGPMVCLQFKQSHKGSVTMTLYKRDGTVIATWQNTKGTRDKMCVPAHLVKKAIGLTVCGCKTPFNKKGRWQQINLSYPAERQALIRGEVLPLCRRN